MLNYEYDVIFKNGTLRSDSLRTWTVRGSNPGGGEIFLICPDRAWDPPSLLYTGYRISFPKVNRPGRGFDRPTPSSAKVTVR